MTETPADTITFGKPLHTDDYALIQVTKPLAAAIRESKTFVIRAALDDYLCFCTDTETYRVKEVETTDTLFITNNIEPPNENEDKPREYTIHAYLQTFLELTKEEGTPYLILKKLFSKYIYEEKEADVATTEKISMDNLLDVIPFSKYEIEEALKLLPVVEINGFLFCLSRDTQSELLTKLVELLDDFDFPEISLTSIKFDDLRRHFDSSIPDSFIGWLLRKYTNEDGTANQYQICQDRAISFLEKNHEVSQEVFERQMIRSLPIGVEMDMKALQGVALFKDSLIYGKMIDYVNVNDLPIVPDERINMLFKIKDSWTIEEIEPYVTDFCPNKAAVPGFILKYCQQIKENGVKRLVKKDIDF